jgi:hypothetical protein
VVKALPEQSLLLERLEYFPETGELRWKKAPRQSKVKDGDLWGSLVSLKGSNGTRIYRAGRFSGVDYYAHRLIWRMVTGEDPGEMLVDHEDRDGLNNRWTNLRLATHGENVENQAGHRRRKSPYKGVYQDKNGRWKAQVRRNKVLHTAPNSFLTPEEAKVAYDELVASLPSRKA